MIENQILIDALFPIGTTAPRRTYKNKKSVESVIELPDVLQLPLTGKIQLSAVLTEAPCFQLKQQHISELLENSIDRSNISRWRWKRDAKNDAKNDKYQETWRNTTIMLVAIYFKDSLESRQPDVFDYMQVAIKDFPTVEIEDIFEWRGERNMPTAQSPLPHASGFVQILQEKGVLTETLSQKALRILSQDFDATVRYFSQKALSLSIDQISTILRLSIHPYFLSGLEAYARYIRPKYNNTSAPKSKQGSQSSQPERPRSKKTY